MTLSEARADRGEAVIIEKFTTISNNLPLVPCPEKVTEGISAAINNTRAMKQHATAACSLRHVPGDVRTYRSDQGFMATIETFPVTDNSSYLRVRSGKIVSPAKSLNVNVRNAAGMAGQTSSYARSISPL